MSIPRTPANTFEHPTDLRGAPKAPRSLRRSTGVAHPEHPTRARGAPGRFEPDYAPMVLGHPRSRRPDRSPSRRNYAIAAYSAGALALMSLGAAAGHFIQNANHAYDVAQELQASPPDVTRALISNGASGVVLVPTPEGEKVSNLANNIATSSSTGEVANILLAQQGEYTTGSLAALPARDLTSVTLRGLPDHGAVTPAGLVAFQGPTAAPQSNP